VASVSAVEALLLVLARYVDLQGRPEGCEIGVFYGSTQAEIRMRPTFEACQPIVSSSQTTLAQ